MNKGEQIFEYKGNNYKKLCLVEMKDPTTREWILSVLYENEQGKKFVRAVADFGSKFNPVKTK